MNSPNTSSEVEKLKQALIKDFKSLYVKQFTTDWEAQRLIRALEIGVMDFSNTLTLLHQSEIKGRINALEELPITEIKESNGRRTNCVLSEEIYKAIEINKFVNQMKGKDK